MAVDALCGFSISDAVKRWAAGGKESPAVREAKAKRRARWESYYVEFLTYGHDEYGATSRADIRMATEAREAEAVKP
jgi:hypothetical protein